MGVTQSPNVKMGCLAYGVNVIIEGQCIVYIFTPRLFTVLVTGTVTSETVTSLIFGSDRCRAAVPITIASDLSGFRQSPLASSQLCTDWKQSLITLTLRDAE